MTESAGKLLEFLVNHISPLSWQGKASREVDMPLETRGGLGGM